MIRKLFEGNELNKRCCRDNANMIIILMKIKPNEMYKHVTTVSIIKVLAKQFK